MGKGGSCRHGFSLIEVTAGLAVASLALLMATVLFGGAVSQSRAIEQRLAEMSERGAGRAWLRAALASLEVGLLDDDTFKGHSDNLSFTARLQTADGWFEPRRVSLQVLNAMLVAATPNDTVLVARDVTGAECQYLLVGGESSEWLRGWESPATAPIAVRLILRHPTANDTLILSVGARS